MTLYQKKPLILSGEEYAHLETKWDKALEDILIEMTRITDNPGLHFPSSRTTGIITAYKTAITQIREFRGLEPNP